VQAIGSACRAPLLLRFTEYSDTSLAFSPSPVGRGWRAAPGEGNTRGKTEASSVTYYEMLNKLAHACQNEGRSNDWELK
jgi:hypothetical protein